MESMEWARQIGRGLASVAICAMAAACMYWTDGETGIGWGILGLLIVWAS